MKKYKGLQEQKQNRVYNKFVKVSEQEMSSKYPYVSEEYKHLLNVSSNNQNTSNINNRNYQYNQPQQFQPQQYQPPQYYSNVKNNSFQYGMNIPQQQPINFLPGFNQNQLKQNNSNNKVNHDSYAADEPNPQYPSLNQYQSNSYTPNPNQNLQDQKQIIHKVQYGDTLQGLSLIYDIPISKIKQRNKIQGDSIYYLKEIIIPNPKTGPMQTAKTQQIMVQEFMTYMPFQQKSRQCARYYLQEHKWNVEQSVKAFKQDLEWQRKNKIKYNSIPINQPVMLADYSQRELLIKKSK